jgi:RND family efflux transporter MFP subunit
MEQWRNPMSLDSHRRPRRRGFLGALHMSYTAFCIGALHACNAGPKEEEEPPAPPIPVTCEAARTGMIGQHVELRGVVHPPPEREVVVSPLAAGRLLAVRVREGDRVTKGQVLALVDDPQLSAAAVETSAARGAAQAAYEHARTVFERAQRLFDRGIAAKREVEEARAAVASAQAELQASRSRYGLAVTQRARTSVTSPIAGVVIHMRSARGDVVDGTNQTPLATIADLTELELRADVPGASLVRLREGVPATIRLDALPDVSLPGLVKMVAPSVDLQTGLGSVRVSIEKNAVPIKVGLPGRADVQTGENVAATLVPRSALRRSAKGEDQVVVCSKSKDTVVADVRAVRLGSQNGDETEIQSGVKEGELVVVDHALGLETGAVLVPRTPETKPAEKSAESPKAERETTP